MAGNGPIALGPFAYEGRPAAAAAYRILWTEWYAAAGGGGVPDPEDRIPAAGGDGGVPAAAQNVWLATVQSLRPAVGPGPLFRASINYAPAGSGGGDGGGGGGGGGAGHWLVVVAAAMTMDEYLAGARECERRAG